MKRISFRQFFLWSFAGCLALLATYYVLFPQVWYCQWIGVSGFKKINNRFYVSADTPLKNFQKAQKSIEEAQMRIATFWKKPIGNGTIVLCNNAEQYYKYCHSDEGAGCSIGTPWGDSYIILNVDGINTDVIAHEMCHDEIFTRLGWWLTTQQIPQWFNEGLALMVDYRFVPQTDSIQRYIDYRDECLYLSNGGQMVLNLDDISSVRGFFNGNQPHVMLAYMTAATEVARWLSVGGRNEVVKMIQKIKEGQHFEELYPKIEKEKKRKQKKPKANASGFFILT